jgi:colanic acid/amylovoran biosynthesis glycosyltransferase
MSADLEHVLRVAYLINIYPKVSHTFIRREIRALEQQGVYVLRIALRGWNEELVDTEDLIERKRTRFVLRDGAKGLLTASAKVLLARPIRFMRTLALALRMGRNSNRPLFVHVIYVAEACQVLLWLRSAGTQHLHAHFGSNSAEIAMFVNMLGGPSWSFTAHGPDEFVNPELTGLAEKVRRCDVMITVTSFGRSQVYRLMEYRYWPKVNLIHCGLEHDFYSSTPKLANNSRRFVCVGRLCSQKGQALLIESAAELLKLGLDFELVLVGDGELRTEIELLVKNLDLQGRVRITGWISNIAVRLELEGARAMVLPSFAEGLPVAIMEAMSLEKPIISTFIAGIPELVEDGKHGWLVPAGDVKALVKAMRDCLNTPSEELERMGRSARQRVLLRHNVDTEAKKLINLFSAKDVSIP